LNLPDSGATEALGAALAAAFDGAPAGACVLHLHGDLGAGKTTCARSLLAALGVAGIIRSPTYPLIEAYPARGLTAVHIDLYRLRSPDELEDLGVRDYWQPRHLILIEWPERGGALLGDADLSLTLSYAATGRQATLLAATAAGRRWLQTLASDTRLSPYLSNLT
jgi:tRNA threonylcarbamoyladenosine biosynthesis protein TsaE